MQLQLFFTCKSKTRSLYNYKNQSGTVYWHLEGCRQSLRLWKGTCGIQIRANEISFRARKMPITASVWRICKIDVTMWDFIVLRKYWASNIAFPNKAIPCQWVHLVIYLFIHVVILSLTKGLLCHTFPGSTFDIVVLWMMLLELSSTQPAQPDSVAPIQQYILGMCQALS